MSDQALRLDTLIQHAASGRLSRREVVKRATALGLGASMTSALLGVSATGAAAQSEIR